MQEKRLKMRKIKFASKVPNSRSLRANKAWTYIASRSVEISKPAFGVLYINLRLSFDFGVDELGPIFLRVF